MADKDKREALYHLALLREGYDNVNIRKSLLNMTRGGFGDIWTRLLDRPHIKKKSELISLNENFEGSINAIYRAKFESIGINDWKFPGTLKDVGCSSPTVYFQGNKDLLYKDAVCIKGSYFAKKTIREMVGEDYEEVWDRYVRDIQEEIFRLMNEGCAIISDVSGDVGEMVLNTAMTGDKRVVGIMKDGLDGRINGGLRKRVLREGLLVSDVPVGTLKMFGKEMKRPWIVKLSGLENYFGNYGVREFFVGNFMKEHKEY